MGRGRERSLKGPDERAVLPPAEAQRWDAVHPALAALLLEHGGVAPERRVPPGEPRKGLSLPLESGRDVLGVNAHVLVLKYSSDFREYRDIMKLMRDVPGVVGVAPFTINPMMVSHKEKTATGILVKGIDPELMPSVLDLPKHITHDGVDNDGDGEVDEPGEGNLIKGLRKPGAKPPERKTRGGLRPPTSPVPLPGAPLAPSGEKDGGNLPGPPGPPGFQKRVPTLRF